MRLPRFLTLMILLLSTLVLNSCEKNPAGLETPNIDVVAIRDLIASDPEVFSQIGVDDDGAQNPTYELGNLTKSEEQINTVKFGRKGKFQLESVDVEFFGKPGEPDTLAIATITRSFNGNFMVVEKDTNPATPESLIVYKKDMANTLVRKVKFHRVANTPDPPKNWRRYEVSMEVCSSVPTTISVSEVKIVPPNSDAIVVTSPLDYFMDRDEGIPTFSQGDTVKVFVTLSNSNHYPPPPGTTVLLHYRCNHRFERARRPFNDAGLYPDVVAGDGIYSGYWIVRRPKGVFHAVIDVIDNGTIFDDVAPYNSVSWGTPYKVE